MFILRQIGEDKKSPKTDDLHDATGVEFNVILGNQYSFIHRNYNYKSFCESYKFVFGREHVADTDSEADKFSKTCYGFIVDDRGCIKHPLYKDQEYYIMTGNGKTFDNVSYR